MTIMRSDLLQKLQTISPALCEHDLVPVLQHFAFTGKQVLAYNERIAMAVPLDTEFKGAVPGKLLLSAVTVGSHADEAKLRDEQGRFRLDIGALRIKLPTMPLAEFTDLFTMPPKPRAGEGITLTDNKLLDALEDCLLSVGGSAVMPDQLGVTVIPDGRTLELFSTNNITLSYAKVKLEQNNEFKERIIIPTEFCEQVIKFKDAGRKQLLLKSKSVLFAADNVLVLGRLITSQENRDFKGALERWVPRNIGNGVVNFNEDQWQRLKIAVEAAVLVTNIKGNEAKTLVDVADNKLSFSSQSERGVVLDQVKAAKHPNAKMALNAELLRQGLGRYQQLLISPRCAILSKGPDNLYVVASYQS